MRKPEYSNASQILKANFMPLSFSIGRTSTASGRSKVEWFVRVPAMHTLRLIEFFAKLISVRKG
jgi:hypothetical protein